MPTALHIAGLSSQSPQGVGAHLVRRLGGAMRSVIVRGITLAGTLRRPAAPQDPRDSAPWRVRVLRRPRAALPAPLLPPPLLARLLAARRHRRPAAATRSAFLNQGDAPFTPETFPQLSPKACAVLNTPLKDCDPKTLKLVVSAFAKHINQIISLEAGMTDPRATLPNLWHRISTALADTKADTSLPATPQAVPATPANALPDAPVASPHPPTPPTGPSAKDAPRVSAGVVSGPTASDQRADATITAAAPKPPPDITAPSGPVVHQSRSFRSDTQSFARWRPRHVRRCRALSTREVSATGCNACRRRGDFIMPPAPGRPERARAESGACPKATNGATARRSRYPDSCQANLADRADAGIAASLSSGPAPTSPNFIRR